MDPLEYIPGDAVLASKLSFCMDLHQRPHADGHVGVGVGPHGMFGSSGLRGMGLLLLLSLAIDHERALCSKCTVVVVCWVWCFALRLACI